MQINVYDAKARLSELIEKALRGEEVIIARSGKPVVRLEPVPDRPRFPYGALADKVKIAEDFDAPLTEDVLSQFEKGL